MVKQAVLFSSGAENASGGDEFVDRERVVFGHPLIARSIIAAARAGVRDFLVVCDEGAERLAALLAENQVLARHDCAVECCNAGDLHALAKAERKDTGDFLLLSDAAICKEEVFARLLHHDLTQAHSLLLLDSNVRKLQNCDGVWRVRLSAAGGGLEDAGFALEPWNTAWTGLALCRAALFWKLLAEFMRSPRGGIYTGFLKIFDPAVTGFVYSVQDYALDVRSESLLALAKRTLLNSVRKASDGFISRHLNRYVSLFFSQICIAAGASPNFISGANLLLALLAAVILACGGYINAVVAGVLFQLTSIIDGSDGEVAKLTWKMSPQGAWIDTICDQLSYALFFIALPIGLYNSPPEDVGAFMIPSLGRETFLLLAGVMLVSLALMFALMAYSVRRARGEGSMLQILKDIEASARKTGPRALLDRVVSKLAFIFRRDFFAFAAMVLLILGLAGALMWATAALCLLLLLYLVYYSVR